MTRVPDLRAAKAEFSRYIADKNRYVSITEQQGPLRHGETRLLARRRWYIKQTLQWDEDGLYWRNKDGRPLIIKDLVWDTVISEMRQLDTYGQRLVWTRIKANVDGILEEDVRSICKVWHKHELSQLNRRDESQWTRDNVDLAAPLRTPSPTRRGQSDVPLRHDATLQDDGTLRDDESSQDDEPPRDGESAEINKPPQDDELSEVNEPIQNDESSNVNESSQDEAQLQDDEPLQNDEPTQEDESSDTNECSQGIASLRNEDPGRQFLRCVLVPQRHPIIDQNPPKRRRANSIERLQKYTKALEEKEAKRPSRQAKKDIDGLRGLGAGIYASTAKPFAKEAAERMARTRALAEFVDNASPEAPRGRQGTAPKKGLRLRSPSSTPGDDDSDGDNSSSDDDDGDWERIRPDPELIAKHRRLGMAMGHNIGQQVAHGPMYA